MKNFYFIKKFSLGLLIFPLFLWAQDCEMLLLNLTGFNADVIAEGTGGDADTKTNYSIDAETWFSNVYYSGDFVPENPANAATAEEYGGGLPNDGFFNSISSGIEYQFADYSDDNAILLRNSFTNTGTLTPENPFAADEIHLAVLSSEGVHTVNVRVNFADETYQEASFQAADWYQLSSPPDAIFYGFGRISRGTGSASVVNTFSDLGVMAIFEKVITINPENVGKAITSISFDKEITTSDAATTVIFAITACEVPILGNHELNNSLFGFYPNPATDFVTIESGKKVSGYEIFNSAGQKMMSGSQLINQKINISGLEKGTYIFRVKLENSQIETFKITKK